MTPDRLFKIGCCVCYAGFSFIPIYYAATEGNTGLLIFSIVMSIGIAFMLVGAARIKT